MMYFSEGRMTNIDKLKKKARQAYTAYHDIWDSRSFSCGANMAAVLCLPLRENAKAFNSAMRELEKQDPGCPKWKPLPEGEDLN
jgi:hypothetical protein